FGVEIRIPDFLAIDREVRTLGVEIVDVRRPERPSDVDADADPAAYVEQGTDRAREHAEGPRAHLADVDRRLGVLRLDAGPIVAPAELQPQGAALDLLQKKRRGRGFAGIRRAERPAERIAPILRANAGAAEAERPPAVMPRDRVAVG